MNTINDVTELKCDSCGTGFNLFEDGGKVERALNTAGSGLFNLEVLCACCNLGHTEYRAKTYAADLLLARTGHSVGEPDSMPA